MKCRFEHSGLCCNSGSRHYEYECKKCECMIPISNAERIRSMTDEELAEFLECFTVCHYCSEYEEASFVESGIPDCDGDCKQHLSDWLRQPYKEDT